MRSINGMHAENMRINEAAVERNAIVGRDGCITVLHHNAGAVYAQVRRDLGKGVIVHVRMYAPSWYSLDARAWAAECVGHLRGVPGLLEDTNVIITPANEQDLAAEGHPGAATSQYPHPTQEVYNYIWTWNITWTMELRRWCPNMAAKIFTAPLAGGHEPAGWPPDWEYQLPTFQAYLARCDGISAHGYCNSNWTGHGPQTGGYWAALRPLRPAGWRERDGTPKIRNLDDPGGVMEQYSAYPCLISEFGNWNHHDAGGSEVAATLEQYKAVYQAYSDSERCIGITPFIWDTGDEHRQNRIRGNVALMRGLAELPRYLASDWTVTPEPESFVERFPEAFAEWEAAGGVEHHFRAHCLATMPSLPVQEEDVKTVLGNAKASIVQVHLLLERLRRQEV